MRININLASNPYEAAREYSRRMGLLVVGLALVAVALVGYILYQRSQTREVDAQISKARQEIASLEAEKGQAVAVLNQPQNRTVADQSQFLNNLFARKALSWTRVFGEMEKLMPPNIHVVSMKPEFNRQGQLVLRVVVATDSRDKAVELVKRMEKSPHFRMPQVEAENTLGQSTGGVVGGNVQFDISAEYVPGGDDIDAEKQEAPEQKTGAKGAGKTASVGGASASGGAL